MKNRLTLWTISLFALLIVLPGCDKDDDDPPTTKTKTELLTTGTWKFSTATSSGVDVSSQIPACIRDNVYTFVAGGNGSFNEGAAKCNSTDPQTPTFTWNFASNETVLHVSALLLPGGSNDFTIVSISETQLVISQVITIGIPMTVIVTLVH
ncbi:MAG TPA: lipocalin family protein [Chitinophagaceae bacterium]